MWIWIIASIYVFSVVGLWIVVRNDIKNIYDDGYGEVGLAEFIVIFIPILNTIVTLMVVCDFVNEIDFSRFIMLRKRKEVDE